ncbi:SGNH/GDSL hydrolase family protein [Mucilaginibacter myungsuensis]|uniref:SGNH/GDSL hydrolase family protein n=1 Tax=Mucilaginibacter myungsuensis TaxID=649104 RepID=A0A929L070_9SPHI|nr:SGNH/GDSL hydrolase family protein [Mucilaginibacter myungsuensis]MBE9663703.1 SGNH/GDSL hydrolase family protein [Mucilaginibacter myungsuensis]MDN3598973.1 SGNH/GDSL hydrolase family protein [Mucilaginibacter myungsuensis]
MKIYLRLFALAVTASLTLNVARAQSVAPFKTGDRVVFLGNSITDGGHYHSYIWLYYMTHFPNMRFTCHNAGIGGDNVKQMSDRLEDEVLPMRPTVLTVTWGMNDTGYFEWFGGDAKEKGQKNVDLAKSRYAVLEAKLKKLPNIKKINILGSPYDETTNSNKNNLYKGKAAAFSQLIDFQEASAKNNGWGVVDFFHPMTDINTREQARNPDFSLTPGDRVHPDNDGHMVMAYQFLKTQGLANKVVADVAINAANKQVSKAVNCSIKNVAGTTDRITFDYLANSLPYAADTMVRGWGNKKRQSDALAYVPFAKEFNQELLTVKGLKAGNYQLMIDNEVISSYSSDQLSEGINLAENPYTPQYQQAIQIRELNEERWDIERRFRQYAFIQFDLLKEKGLLYKDDRAAVDTVNKESIKNAFVRGNKDNYLKARYKNIRQAWQKQMDVLIDQIYTINKPLNHKVTLQLVK